MGRQEARKPGMKHRTWGEDRLSGRKSGTGIPQRATARSRCFRLEFYKPPPQAAAASPSREPRAEPRSAPAPCKKNPPGRSRADNAGPASDRNDRHDAERFRVDDQDLVPDDDELVSAILRDDLHEHGRQYHEPDVPRNHGSDRDREVHGVDARTRLLHDDVADLGPLLRRELNRAL